MMNSQTYSPDLSCGKGAFGYKKLPCIHLPAGNPSRYCLGSETNKMWTKITWAFCVRSQLRGRLVGVALALKCNSKTIAKKAPGRVVVLLNSKNDNAADLRRAMMMSAIASRGRSKRLVQHSSGLSVLSYLLQRTRKPAVMDKFMKVVLPREPTC